MLIGGFAMVAHGAARFTKGIDLLVDEAPENVARVKRALSVLVDNAAAEVADTDVRDYVVVWIADGVIIDLMGRACGLSYVDVKRRYSGSKRHAVGWVAELADDVELPPT